MPCKTARWSATPPLLRGQKPALAFGTAVPFGLTPQQQNTWLYEGGGKQSLDRIYSDFGVHSFPAGNTGPQMGGWFRELDGPASLKGEDADPWPWGDGRHGRERASVARR